MHANAPVNKGRIGRRQATFGVVLFIRNSRTAVDRRDGLSKARRSIRTLKEKVMGIREDYQALMEKQLNEWKAQTERFKAGVEQMGAQVKAQYEKNLELLRAKQEEAWQNFYKLKAANESAWEQLKAHMDKAGGELKDAVERMTTIFKK
jgi:hypothetical protein